MVFEGRDAAGKGGVIKRITERTSPRRRAASSPSARRPSARRRSGTSSATSPHLPAAGEIVLFDRSWYNRAGVERVMGFCTDEEYAEFLRSCPEFERMLVRSRDQAHQVLVLASATRSRSGASRPASTTRCAAGSSARWTSSRARSGSTTRAPRTRCSATPTSSRRPGTWCRPTTSAARRLNCISHLLSQIDYEDVTPPPLELPPRQPDTSYVRPPMADQTFVPAVF